MKTLRVFRLPLVFVFCALFSAGAFAEAVDPAEFNRLKADVEQLKNDVQKPGITNFILAGYGFTGFNAAAGGASTFTAGFNPVFIWQTRDNILFESELELELNGDVAELHLEHADVSYELNDFVTLGAGKFISPFGIFNKRFEPRWANKLTDKPFGIEDATALEAEAQLGLQVHGNLPLARDISGNYAFYVSNGPSLITTPSNAGELSFFNTADNNSNKAFGGRAGLVPAPGLEAGYSFETSRVGDKGSAYENTGAVIQSVDLAWLYDSDAIAGTLRFFAEDIWSSVDPADYGTTAGAFKNDRQACYAQLSYRPSSLEMVFLKNLEGVFRFDTVDRPEGAPNNADLARYTWALDYWFNQLTVIKLSYERSIEAGTSAGSDSFFGEFAVGF
jgi:hypothetical protein